MPNVLVDIEYCDVCNSKQRCLELSSIIRQEIPEANVICRSGRNGTFEVQINGKLVHSKLSSLAFPKYDQVVENVLSAQEGRPVNIVEQEPITQCVLQ